MKKMHTKILAVLLAAVMVIGGFPVVSIAASPSIDSTAEYNLVNKATGKVLERTLDTSYAPTRSDVFRVVASTNTGSDNQKWQLSNMGVDYRPLCVSDRGIGLHKTSESYGPIPGANYVMAVNYNCPPQQTWKIEDAGNGYVTLKNTFHEQTGAYDLPQYLAVTQDEYSQISGSLVVAAIANGSADNVLWTLQKVEGTGQQPLTPFEPVQNVVPDAQYPLEAGSVKLSGMVDKAAVHVQNDELKKLDWKKLVDQFRNKTDTDNRWRGEFWGKYMRGASFTYTYTQDEELYGILEQSVRDILTTQDGSGKITSYPVDWGTWDIWGRKYVMLGLESFLTICKDEQLHGQVMEALCRHADYMLSYLGPDSDGKIPIVDTGYWSGIASSSILEPMVDLYRLTGYQRYLDFSTQIVNSGLTNVGINIFDLAYKGEKIPSEYFQNNAKAYELTSCFEGLAEYYRITGDKKWLTACLNYYHLASENEITVAGSGGGVGHGAGYSYFNPNGDEQWNNMAVNQTDPTIKQMQETCITVTWMKYCFQMLRLVGDSTIADNIEISGYNALIGALKAEGVQTPDYPFIFDYFSLLNGTRKNPAGGAIFDSDGTPIGSCCSANGSSGTGLLPYIEMTRSDNGVVFNMYNPGEITAPTPSGQTVDFAVDTAYPKDGNVQITVTPKQEEQFAVSLRIPGWSAQTTLKVNGETQADIHSGQYAVLDRVWKAGDKIELTLDMRTRIIKDAKGLGLVALQRGPITLARDARFGEDINDPVSIATDADGYAVLTPCETAVPCNMAFEVATTKGELFHVLDFASAGQTWDGASRYATWLNTVQPADPGIQEETEYVLTSQGTGATMTGNPNTNNVEKGVQPVGNTVPGSQLWTFVPEGNYYKVVNVGNGKLLSINTTTSVGNGSNVELQAATGTDNQLWSITKSGDGYIKIAGKLGRQLVSEAGDSNNIHLWEDVANPVQVWKLTVYQTAAVDKSALEAAIAEASTYESKEADYTADSWNIFKDAIVNANAVFTDANTTQGSVDQARTSLLSAINSLIKIVVDETPPAVNVALNKTATASSYNVANDAIYTPSRALDGNTSTYWCSSSGTFPQWLKVDLGSAYSLTSIKQRFHDTDNSTFYYKMEGSNDDSSWTVLVDRTSSGQAGQTFTESVSGSYRYVKMTVTNVTNGNWTSSDEFEVYSLSLDFAALNTAIEKTQALVETTYTPASWSLLQQALTSANQVKTSISASQSIINSACKQLTDAMDGLVAKSNKTSITNLITTADGYNTNIDDYVTSGKAEFIAALAAAKVVRDNVNAVQTDADVASTRLLTAMMALRFKADKATLAKILAKQQV